VANHKSAIKRHKQSVRRNVRNRTARTRAKHVVKEVRAAIRSKDREQAQQALTAATSILHKVAGKGVIHWKKAARKVSRLARAVNGMGDQGPAG
jgi:small subunit ribosomal protein S20